MDRDPNRGRGERLHVDLSEAGAVERVRGGRAEALDVEVLDPAPDLLVHRERDPQRDAGSVGVPVRYAIAAMISATPALSSAPSNVVPLLVTMSWPTRAASAGRSAGSRTWRESPGRVIGSPSHASCTIGDTPAPSTSGDVSTCATRPIVGPSTVPGRVANTACPSLSTASSRPIARSSSTSSRDRSSCFSVLGRCAMPYAPCVSIRA